MIAVLALAIASGLAGGCSGPDIQFVEGVVTLDGKPLPQAIICFTPDDGGLPATGMTAQDGSFRLSATQGGQFGRGTTPGTYTVTVSKLVRLGTPEAEEAGPQLFPGDGDIRRVTPSIYGDSKNSPLRATVARGRNTLRFELRRDAE
jgi:hypothetical protein